MRQRACFACAAAAALVLPGCWSAPFGGASDVPFFTPNAWPSDSDYVLIRADSEGSDVLLLTSQSQEQRNAREDGEVPGSGHSPVYRFDPDALTVERVTDAAWDEATGAVTDCNFFHKRHSNFEVRFSGELQYNDTKMDVAGGTALAVIPAPQNDVVAVLSTSGSASISFFIIGFPATGQRYHQLYSEVDGTPVGPALRIPLDTGTYSTPGCWTADEKYVVYRDDRLGYGRQWKRIAIVRVAEVVDEVFPERVSDVPSFVPAGWGEPVPTVWGDPAMLIRPLSVNGDVLLIAEYDDSAACPLYGPEWCDESARYVYQYDPTDDGFESVPDQTWHDADSIITACAHLLTAARASRFTLVGEGPYRLQLWGSEIPVAGGNVVAIFPAPASDVTAVLSTDGVPVPRGGSSGQHYHQLFSEITGMPFGEPIRIGVSASVRSPEWACWASDERYVVYAHTEFADGAERIELISIAPGYASFKGDCNQDGVSDEVQLADDPSSDCDANGIPDQCQDGFVWFYDDFESEQGWNVGADDDIATAGAWERIEPAGYSLSGDRTPNIGSMCFVAEPIIVEPGSGIHLSGGRTTLLSPTFELSGVADPRIGYWRWHSEWMVPNGDLFTVDISPDDGTTWVNVETLGVTLDDVPEQWVYHEFQVSDFVPPTSQIQLRFVAADVGDPSLVEVAVDDVQILVSECFP